jgi:hypothetical protein
MPDHYEPPDLVARLIQALPWIVVVAVLGAIFVFTAYAVTGKDGAMRCVDPAGATVACSTVGAKVVVVEVEPSARCPNGTEALVTEDDPKKLCLDS